MFGRATGEVRAVDDVSFAVLPGECLGLVGESGSGKTTVGRTILRAMPPTAGEVLFQLDDKSIDLATMPAKELRSLRRHFQMVFQDPYSSLNPRMTVLDIIGEPLLIHGMRSRKAREERVCALLRQVGMQEQHLNRYPHAFSGGQRQRIGIARALALNPRLIVADEPVSALDVSVQAQVLNLLRELQEGLGLTYLFIAHDLSVVRHVCDRVAVMYAGKIVEMAAVDDLYGMPRHPYTEALLSAIPIPDPRRRSQRILLSGEVADPAHLPTGCAFHPRCRYAEARCREQAPEMREIAPNREVRCHRAEELELAGNG
ncbi:MAG TPA: oligopeptide/dipeptide ABC transporter ATP-binding protein [Armatimonadota bacterium]